MKQPMFSIRDLKAETYCAPFVSLNERTAERDFENAVNDPASIIGRNPADFILYKVGTWDDELGALEPDKLSLAVVFGTDLVRPK